MPTCREVLEERAIALAWSLWAELGVSGWHRAHTSHAIDPERLILFTASLCDLDPRLRDEATDWCVTYGRYVSAARLKNICAEQTTDVRVAFGRLAATINANSSLRWPGGTTTRDFQRTARSAIADFGRPSLVVVRLRALFGVGARAEVVRAFTAEPSARFSAAGLAGEAAYTKRNVAEALEALRMAGLLVAEPVRNQRLYRLADPGWVTSLPGSLPTSFPRWKSVFRTLDGFLTGAREAEALTPRVRSVVAADILHDLETDLLSVGARLPRPTDGLDPWTTMERLALDMSSAWAAGSEM